MSYKIAVGSSEGINIDLKFGEVKTFLIYEVYGTQVQFLEEREVKDISKGRKTDPSTPCGKLLCERNGCSGTGTGCNRASDIIDKVSIISDCRCVVCKKVGFQAQKQFEKKAISVFDVECEITEALNKIVVYYNKLDRHESFMKRGQ